MVSEILRRIRFVWAILWLIAAALMAVSWFGYNSPTTLWWIGGAVAAALSPYARSWRAGLSSLWLLGVGCLAGGIAVQTQEQVRYAALVIGLWVAGAVAVWIFSPAARAQER